MNDFEATLLERNQRYHHIQTLVDLIELDIEQSNDSESTIAVGGETFLRRLSDGEQDTLKRDCSCTCTNDDFSKLYLMLSVAAKDPKNSDKSIDLKHLVSNTHFDGFCVLDLTEEKNEYSKSYDKQSPCYRIPPGLHFNLCVSDSIISLKSARVYRNSFISKTFVGVNAVLMNCGQVCVSEKMDSLQQMTISVGAESGGGRSLSLTPESTMIDVCRQLKPSEEKTNSDLISPVPSFQFNVLLEGSMVCETPQVQNTFLYPSSTIEAAYSVTNAMLFENAQIKSGSIVSNVVMQWNASISGNSTVNEVFMMEQSHLGPSSTVESTIMGPDSHASCGEVHATVFGPLTNAHHQSLLIGILWPLGRGNVAYGSNVGSNHTGRLPDQECSVGEGVFWGLSCVIKFPTDLSLAPYSMIAAGTKFPPQRITFPFSLIVESSSDSSHNEIVPGWVLQHTPYTLVRNDKKFATRRKAKRHAYYTGWKILRPSTIEMCRNARNSLQQSLDELPLSPLQTNALRLKNVPGIGACKLTERACLGGIKNYTNGIQLYALRGLLSWLNDTLEKEDSGDESVSVWSNLEKEFQIRPESNLIVEDSSRLEWPSFPWEGDDDSNSEWVYQKTLLVEEFPTGNKTCDTKWITSLLNNLLSLEKDLAERIAKCKRRDDIRGAATVPGYSDSHVAADDDAVIIDAWEQQKHAEERIEKILSRIHEHLS